MIHKILDYMTCVAMRSLYLL